MSGLLWRIRETSVADHAYRSLRNVIQGPGWGGFHQDRIYRGLVLELLSAFPFSSFIETGTYRGHSTELVASRFPDLPVYTSEVVESTYTRSKGFLSKYKNTTCMLGSSDAIVHGLIEDAKVGAMPLYYLDAHWERYWPLRTELEHIGRSGMRCAIVIDDFEVPRLDRFGFDIDGGGTIVEGEKCNLDYITPALASGGQRYHALFPRYTAQEAFGPSGRGMLRGHIALFQNMPDEYEAFLRRPFTEKYYTAMGAVATVPTGSAFAGSA